MLSGGSEGCGHVRMGKQISFLIQQKTNAAFLSHDFEKSIEVKPKQKIILLHSIKDVAEPMWGTTVYFDEAAHPIKTEYAMHFSYGISRFCLKVIDPKENTTELLDPRGRHLADISWAGSVRNVNAPTKDVSDILAHAVHVLLGIKNGKSHCGNALGTTESPEEADHWIVKPLFWQFKEI